ncbi:hypothetical protein [Streptomyces sp. t39]|uniref:hypothetical protein n=1 Tax=Streptomyces sp. t39 TaxID=1828156 RepID=UPI0011CDF719|nr:hypothetical protein [Streptomyces sp. t39]TXS44307.1 hypothetical protein EAO77_34925 [Streptomyces sp. t39]
MTKFQSDKRTPASSVLELIALLCLIGLAAVVYAATGPEAFAAVTGVGVGLFTTWRGRSGPPGAR